MLRKGMDVTVAGYRGVAFWVRSVSRGRAKVTMIGDDRVFDVDEDDCTPLAREDYCGVCGQIGCRCDGLERRD